MSGVWSHSLRFSPLLPASPTTLKAPGCFPMWLEQGPSVSSPLDFCFQHQTPSRSGRAAQQFLVPTADPDFSLCVPNETRLPENGSPSALASPVLLPLRPTDSPQTPPAPAPSFPASLSYLMDCKGLQPVRLAGCAPRPGLRFLGVRDFHCQNRVVGHPVIVSPLPRQLPSNKCSLTTARKLFL